MIGVILFLCFVWPLFGTAPKPTGGNILDANVPSFSSGHPLGTDQVGNDLWSRLLYGGRNSLEIAFAVNLIGLVLGGLLGAFAAYWGSFTDTVIMRILDVLIAFPSLVLALAVAQSLGASKLHTIYALCFFSVPAFARLARAGTLRLRERPFMLAARLAGTRAPRILLRHVAPNIVPQLATFGLLGIGVTIILEGALSFLGLGVPPPEPSWGNMIFDGQAVLSAEPKLVLLPSAFLFVTVLAFNLLGDALRARGNAS
jgi:peptide/nickel transport system permease protein